MKEAKLHISSALLIQADVAIKNNRKLSNTVSETGDYTEIARTFCSWTEDR